MKIIKYGLIKKGTSKLLQFETSSNSDGEFCNEIKYSLVENGQADWLVDDKETAAYVKSNSTEWYNASYETPEHDFKKDELDVAQVEIITSKLIDEVPDYEEFMKRRIKVSDSESEKKELTYYLNQYLKTPRNNRSRFQYSLYQFRELLRVEKEGNR